MTTCDLRVLRRRGRLFALLAFSRFAWLFAAVGPGSEAFAAAGSAAQSSSAQTPIQQTVEGLRSELKRASVPLGPFERKLEEGLAKSVPPPLLTTALKRIADNLMWLHGEARLCGFNRNKPEAEARMLALGNDLLLSGIPRDGLSDVLRLLCKRDGTLDAWLHLGELYFYLVGRLQADSEDTWRLCSQVARRSESRAAVDRVVFALQDIHRQRGTVTHALTFAVARSQSGASMRTLRNELRERFLRR